MEKIFKDLLNQVICPKYPSISNIDRVYTFTNENQWMVNITTHNCLETEEMMEIDSEIKDLFKMFNPENKRNRKNIKTWFRCNGNDLYDFSHIRGYHH